MLYAACVGMIIGVCMIVLPEYFMTIKANARPPTRNDEHDHT